MLVDLVIVRPDEFSGSETSALSENPARNFINIISEIDIGTSVCVCVCVCEREVGKLAIEEIHESRFFVKRNERRRRSKEKENEENEDD